MMDTLSVEKAKRICGRLLATIKVLKVLRKKKNEEGIQNIEKCFSKSGTHIKKVKRLDGLLKQFSENIF